MKNEQGFALVHGMILCVVVTILAAAALQRSSSVATDNRLDRATLRAHFAAEGGLALARNALRTKRHFEPRATCIGRAEVTVEARLVEPGQWEIVSRASVRTRGQERVVVTLREPFEV